MLVVIYLSMADSEEVLVAGLLDAQAKAQALFARLKKNGTWQCPTLTVLRSGALVNDPEFVTAPQCVPLQHPYSQAI